MDRETVWCVIGDTIPENCVEFFRVLNDSGVKATKPNVEDLTDKTAERFAVGVAISSTKFDSQLLEYISTSAVSIFRSLEHSTSLAGGA